MGARGNTDIRADPAQRGMDIRKLDHTSRAGLSESPESSRADEIVMLTGFSRRSQGDNQVRQTNSRYFASGAELFPDFTSSPNPASMTADVVDFPGFAPP